jgi:hypothetical protein
MAIHSKPSDLGPVAHQASHQLTVSPSLEPLSTPSIEDGYKDIHSTSDQCTGE